MIPCEEDDWVPLGLRKVWIRAQNIYARYISQVPYGNALEVSWETKDGSYAHSVVFKHSPEYAMVYALIGLVIGMREEAIEAQKNSAAQLEAAKAEIQSLRIRIDSFFCCPNCHVCEHAEEAISAIAKCHEPEVK